MTVAALSRTIGIPLNYANRHGLITGQTGTGKTVSLMRLAESFASQGVPVFVSDVKGDIAALSRSCPATVYDVFGKSGIPLKASIQGIGADLLARALELTDTQSGCLEIAFAYADIMALPLATIDDLRAVLAAMLAAREHVSRTYGQVSPASIGVIQRALLRLEAQGAKQFFGTPSFDVAALLQPGLVSILDSTRLIDSPRVYGAFLLWLLGELRQRLPEVGDLEKPRLVMFFDESHLLFQDCPAALLRRIEQTVRLIRSKGVGVYFVSQSAADIPDLIRQQLAHRIEHSRALPVGTAIVETMTAAGQPAKPVKVQIDKPACDLGALSVQEQSRFQQAAVPAETATYRTPASEIWFALGVCFVAFLFLGGMAYWFGSFGKAAAAIGALILIGAFKR